MPDYQLPNLKVGQPRGSESPTYPGIHPGERRPGGDPGGRRRRGDQGGQATGVPGRLQPEYDWDAAATDDEGVTDSAGAAGPAYRVRPRVVFGWDVDMRAPTRWSFTDSITSLTP